MFILNTLFSIGNIGFQSVNAEIPVTDTQFRTPQSPFKFNASEWFFVSWVGQQIDHASFLKTECFSTNPILEKIFPCQEKRTIFLEKLAIYQGLQLIMIPIEMADTPNSLMVIISYLFTLLIKLKLQFFFNFTLVLCNVVNYVNFFYLDRQRQDRAQATF